MSPPDGPDPTTAIAGLASELEAMAAVLRGLGQLPERVAELGEIVEHLAEQVANRITPPEVTGPVSWLDLVDHPEPVLTDLFRWMRRVYLRFPDASQHLPDCWLWHPDAVEELLWLRQTWAVAYHPVAGSPQLAGDWHDRYRPGVVRRIRERAGACSPERHQTDDRPAPGIPLAEATELIVLWWHHDRVGAPPAPSDEHLAASERLRRARTGARP